MTRVVLTAMAMVALLYFAPCPKAQTLAPDGSYVGGNSYTMAPDGRYVGNGR